MQVILWVNCKKNHQNAHVLQGKPWHILGAHFCLVLVYWTVGWSAFGLSAYYVHVTTH